MRRLIIRMSSFLLAYFVEQKEIDKKLIKIAKKSFQCPIRGRKAIKRKIIKGDKKTFLEIEFSSCSAVFGERIHFLFNPFNFLSLFCNWTVWRRRRNHIFLSFLTGMRFNINLIFHYLNWFRQSFLSTASAECVCVRVQEAGFNYLWSLCCFLISSQILKNFFYFLNSCIKRKNFYSEAWKSFSFLYCLHW